MGKTVRVRVSPRAFHPAFVKHEPPQSFEPPNAERRILPILFGLATAVLCAWIYRHSIRYGGAASWDGFERSAWAANVWLAVRGFDPAALWRDTHAQVVWPFLHSWVTGFLFLLFGPSLQTARLVCLASFWGAAMLMAGRFIRRPGSNAPAGAAVPWLLFASSPFMIQHAASVMSELPGLFLVMAAAATFPASAAPLAAIPCGALTGLLFLYKYNYAALTYIALLIAAAARSRYSFEPLFSRKNAVLFGLPLLMLALWFAPNPARKIEGFLWFAANNPNARAPLNLESLWFYPANIPKTYFAHPALAWLAAALVASAAFLSRRETRLSPAVCCFAVHFAAAVAHPMKDIRFVLIPVGLFFWMAGSAATAWLDRLGMDRRERWRTYAPALAGLAAMAALPLLKPMYEVPRVSQNRDYLSALKVIERAVGPDNRTAFLIAHDYVPPPAVSFSLIAAWKTAQPAPDGRLRWHYPFLFEPQSAWEALSEDERAAKMREAFFANRDTRVVAAETTAPEKIPRFAELYGGAGLAAQTMPRLDEFQLESEHPFPTFDMRIRIYSLR